MGLLFRVIGLLVISFYIFSIPSLLKFKYRGKKAEGLIQLSSLYTAQTSFYGDFGFYAGCLDYMGYTPLPKNERLYAVGFKKIEIDKEYVKKILEKDNAKISKEVLEKCINNPTQFYENGQLAKVSLDDFPDDAKVVVDKNGKTHFKLYAVAKDKNGGKSVLSIDDFKRREVHDSSWEYDEGGERRNALIALLVLNVYILLFMRIIKNNPWIIWFELALIQGLLMFSYIDRPYFPKLIVPTLVIHIFILAVRAKVVQIVDRGKRQE